MAITTAEAARLLQISTREVRRLIATGDLQAEAVGRIFLLDEASVHARQRSPVRRGRALATGTAWAVLLEASGERAGWLDRPTRSRIKSWLRRHAPEEISAACRKRAVRHDLRVLPAYLDAVILSEGVVPGGMTAAGSTDADIVTFGEAPREFYCTGEALTHLRQAYHLSTAGEPNLIARVPLFDNPQVLARDVMPVAVIAVDLLESADVRTRRAGGDLLRTAMDRNIS
ncbi:MAG TPA: helix-turn-helix domain-containing protein [Kineosporiaceae bacterium]|nr:helix-turn-helix domain-containing protein [Kineosporiaceae bacterium]